MNLVAADVSPLTYRPRAKLEPTHVGLRRFMVPMRGRRPWRLSMNRGLNVTGSVSSLSPRGTSGERAGERATQTNTASPPRPSPPSFLRRRGRSRRFTVPDARLFPRRPVAVVDVGKGVVHRLDPSEPLLVHAGGRQLLMQGDEAQQMILDALAGVIGTGAGAQDERPIAGLRQEQLARGLFEGTQGQFVRFAETIGQRAHAFLRHPQVRVNPFVGLIEPHFPITFLAPTGGAGLADLLRRLAAQVIQRGGQGE